MTDLATKALGLAAIIEANLRTFDSAFRVDTRLRAFAFRAQGPADRRKVMGSPARYATVYPVSMAFSEQESELLIGGEPLERGDTFRVELFFGFYDAEEYGVSSQAAFDSITGSEAGLLPVLAGTGYVAAMEARVGVPQNIALEQPLPLDSLAEEIAHYATFTITVT